MKFIENFIDVDLKGKNNEHLLINGNNGYSDVIYSEEYAQVELFRQGKISFEQIDDELYQSLVRREYVVNDSYDEEKQRINIYSTVKSVNEKRYKKHCRVHFVLTYNCNFSCPYCYEKDRKNKKVLSKEQVDRVFSLYDNQIENIGLFGGEPFLLSNRKVIEYIISKAPEATYNVTTNGYYLEEYIDLLKKVRVVSIQVTLDGTKIWNDKTRILENGEGTYEKIRRGIELCLKNGFPLTVRMNVHENNIEDCMAEKKMLEKIPCAKENLRFNIQPIFQSGDFRKTSLYKRVLEENEIDGRKNKLLRNLPPISKAIYEKKPLKPVIKACDTDCFYRFYDPFGNIYSCILAVGDKTKRIGTYYPTTEYEEDSFVKRDIMSIPKCRKCKYALLCGGGCANSLPKGCRLTETPNCHTLLYDIREMVPLVYNIMKESKINET